MKVQTNANSKHKHEQLDNREYWKRRKKGNISKTNAQETKGLTAHAC